ncbi:PREDICTED: DNA-directed RNA polymerase, mitochondrial [Gekko japonicus]|uniref:DNA-directed RNA polymerase n=1 Tax=Gekko japonicus TaxID=146911 RepID=A0ABM1LH10_GEKJA|nr:PREDICTED: DNA-directed RNA polymerase, mitochondrial [Gekko japonicus]
MRWEEAGHQCGKFSPSLIDPESLWIVVRSHSSARAKEEARSRWACEKAELLEVLEARVKQLQADNVCEVVAPEAQEAPSRKSGFSKAAPWKGAAPIQKAPAPKHEDRGTSHPSRWMEKLNKEKSIKHKRLLRLEAKLLAASPRTKPTKRDKAAQGEESPPKRPTGGRPNSPGKCQAPKETKSRRNVPSAGPLEGSRGTSEGPEEQARIWEDAGERLPLEEEEERRHVNIRLSILAYLDCCLFLGQTERAQQCLMFYHRSHSRRKLLDIQMYNCLMRGYAKKGALSQVGQLFQRLDEAGLKPNLESYVAALECMGRSNVSPEVIARCLQQLKADGIQLEDLWKDSQHEEDGVKMALKAIRRVKPDFEPPSPVRPADICTVPLFKDFYTKEKPVSYPKLEFTAQELRERFREQLQLEASNMVTIDSVEADKPLTEQAVKARELLAVLRSRWRAALLQSFQETKLRLGQRTLGQLSLYPFLCVLKNEEYVDILIRGISSLPPQGESLLILARELGTKVYNKYVMQKKSWSRLVEKIQHVYDSYAQLLAKDTPPDHYLPREYWEQLEAEAGYGSSLVAQECVWPHSLLVQLGLHLVELLVQVLKMESNLLTPGLEPKLIPILYHVYSFRSGRQIGFIRPHPILTRLVSEAAETTLTFDSFVIPMLCPPVPWVSPSFGAYILNPTKLMRCVDGAVQHQLLLERCPRGNLFSVMDALNQLGNCPWKVNRAILDIVISIFNDKGNEKLDVPPPPSEAPQPTRLALGGAPLTKSALKREMAQCRKKAMEMFSLRMDTLYKLSIARHMGDQAFWFPHNMDFRGRTYPCPPHFNHLGNDLTRAILVFAEGKPLGPRGLDWLKIHLINLTGLKKKSSLQDRLAYANEIMEDVLDSADRPLTSSSVLCEGQGFQALGGRGVREAEESLAIWLAYRLPYAPADTLLDLLEAVSSRALEYPRLRVLGDFSVRASSSQAVDLASSVAALGLSRIGTAPTHQAGHTLDLILEMGRNVDPMMIDVVPQSDHFAPKARLSIPRPSRFRGELIYAHPQRLMDPSGLQNALWERIPPGSSLDELVEDWASQLSKAIDEIALLWPLRPPVPVPKQPAPWYNPELRRLEWEPRRLEIPQLCTRDKNTTIQISIREFVWEASHYLVQQVFNSLREMFSGTREIQGWLTESARHIAKSGRTVEWVTPLGLPIVQPYHRSKTTQVNSSMQTVNLKSRHDASQKPDTVKQKNAFPPNFIHSLDSTHMMLTALHCHRRGLTFVSVHDCYWTHALTVDIMNQVCREQFVELHSQPILQDLSKFMLQKYCAKSPTQWRGKAALEYRRLVQLLSKVPNSGDFDLQKVKESTYFFS